MRYLLALILSGLAAQAADWYVATNGTAGGTGAIGSPWNLGTAFTNPASVSGGDTIWLRGGTYTGQFTSALKGIPNNSITVKPYTGETVVLDRAATNSEALIINGYWTTFIGLDVGNSGTTRHLEDAVVAGGHSSIEVFGTNISLINLFTHDGANGIHAGLDATNTFIYGCISYHNGYQSPTDANDRGHGHAYYLQGQDKIVRNNIGFDNYCNGVQVFTESQPVVSNWEFSENIMFNPGSIANGGSNWVGRQFIIGSSITPVINLRMTNNYGFSPTNHIRTINDFGYADGSGTTVNRDIVSHGNYLVGGAIAFANWTNSIVCSNTFVLGPAAWSFLQTTNAPSTWNWDYNNYYVPFGLVNTFVFGPGGITWANRQALGLDVHSATSAAWPTQNKIFVVTNAYESGRFHAAIFNWQMLDNVLVDVSGKYSEGVTVRVRNVQALSTPINRTVSGGTISLPMTNWVADSAVNCTNIPTVRQQFQTFLLTSGASQQEGAPVGGGAIRVGTLRAGKLIKR